VRAAVCREHGAPLVIEELELDRPQAGEVLVDVHACAVCHSDITYASGGWGGALPAVYGHEAAGVVAEVGPGVAGIAPGDRVVVTLIRSCGACPACTGGRPALCEGAVPLSGRSPLRDASGAPVVQGMNAAGFAEQALVHHSQVAPLPDDVGFVTGSLLGCGVITGVGAVVTTADVSPGESAVVIGAGGVGLNCIQGAALRGANPIVAIDVVSAKLEAARAFGATATVDAQREDVVAAVAELTGGRMADHVFVSVGAPAAFAQGISLMGRGGETVIVGMPANGITCAFDPGDLADRGQRIVGSKMGGAHVQVDIPHLLGLYRAGRLKLDELVSGTYPLDEIDEAFASVTRGEALRNVIVLR
jgi:Zn-dependent alcohol dehydrogenase